MKPSIPDMLRCILDNLEELVFPRLDEAHAQSVARCTSILLRVVLLRLEGEQSLLAADSREKRALFSWVATRLAGDGPPRLAALAPQLEAAGRERPLVPVAPEALHEENEHLKTTMQHLIEALHAERSLLGDERFMSLQTEVRRQLRRQLDREAALIAEPYAGPGFPY